MTVDGENPQDLFFAIAGGGDKCKVEQQQTNGDIITRKLRDKEMLLFTISLLGAVDVCILGASGKELARGC